MPLEAEEGARFLRGLRVQGDVGVNGRKRPHHRANTHILVKFRRAEGDIGGRAVGNGRRRKRGRGRRRGCWRAGGNRLQRQIGGSGGFGHLAAGRLRGLVESGGFLRGGIGLGLQGGQFFGAGSGGAGIVQTLLRLSGAGLRSGGVFVSFVSDGLQFLQALGLGLFDLQESEIPRPAHQQQEEQKEQQHATRNTRPNFDLPG